MENKVSTPDNLRQYMTRISVGATLVVLTACGGTSPEATPEDTSTYVSTGAHGIEINPQSYIDTTTLTNAIKLEAEARKYTTSTSNSSAPTSPSISAPSSATSIPNSPYTLFKNINPATGKDEANTPPYESAPVLTVRLNEHKKLVYEDATPSSLTTDERKILMAVNANSPLLAEVMASNRAHTLQFKVYEKDKEQGDSMFFIPNDYNDEGKPNIYYLLPANTRMDSISMQAMLTHEGIHAALDHNNRDALPPEQKAIYEKACNTLRTSALNDIGTYNTAEFDLSDMMRSAPPALQPAYKTVITALRNKTFGELPTLDLTPDEITQCYIQAPTRAVSKQALLMGVQPLLKDHLSIIENEKASGKIKDKWNEALRSYTVYKYLKEAHWLPPTPANKRKGHPQDGQGELTASAINRLLNDPERFGKDIAPIKTEDSQAIIDVLDTATTLFTQKYPDATEFHAMIKERRAIFDTAYAGR